MNNTRNNKSTHTSGHRSRDLVDELLADYGDEYVAPLELPLSIRKTRASESKEGASLEAGASPKSHTSRGVIRQAELEGLEALERLHARRDGVMGGIRRAFPHARSLLGIGLLGGTALAALLFIGAAISRR